jgi:hypothetical protein
METNYALPNNSLSTLTPEETIPALGSYARQYETAKSELASGHKDTGLRILWKLRFYLSQTPAQDTDITRLKKHVNETTALFGLGFDWD